MFIRMNAGIAKISIFSKPYAFATSSIDALIHAMESYLSPKATPMSEIFSLKAMRMIIKGYLEMAGKGLDARNAIISEFLHAGTYAGIGFGNAGTGYVFKTRVASLL